MSYTSTSLAATAILSTTVFVMTHIMALFHLLDLVKGCFGDISTVQVACILAAIFVVSFYALNYCRSHTAPEACRKLGIGTRGNLADEQDAKYSGTTQHGGNVSWKVKSLWIYPVKSCKGVELDQATVTGTGMDYDRQFSFARRIEQANAEPSEHEWKFLSMRHIPVLANVKTEVWVPDASSPSYSPNHPNVRSEGVIVIKYPSFSKGASALTKAWKTVIRSSEISVHLPFNPTPEQIKAHGYDVEPMIIWKDKPQSLKIACSSDGTPWIQGLQDYLTIECRLQNINANVNRLALFRVAKEDPREVFRCAPRKAQLGYQPSVGFQDAYPLHLMNLASVRSVGNNFEDDAPPLSARNFRSNIIVAGGEAHAEDHWKLAKIGGEIYHVSCRTVRCLLPNVDQDNGERHRSEPNKTLKRTRLIDKGDPNNACLGMQMVPAAEDRKIVRVGDEVEVLETGEHFYIKQ